VSPTFARTLCTMVKRVYQWFFGYNSWNRLIFGLGPILRSGRKIEL
jgi:hypothetical protein